MDYHQAPVLDKLVESNALAPVEQRLPVDPLVIEPVDRVGDYGGKLRRAILGGGDQHNIIRMVGHENLVNWDIEWSKVIPNIAKSFEINDTSTEFTFTLRDGMKWSDGEPFTTDDIQFWYQDVFLNPVLTPVKNALFVHNDKKVQLEIIDKKTFKFKFDDPNGLFLYNLAYGTGFLPVNYPAHYLKQFHADYNPDVDKLVANEPAVNNWQQLFLLKGAPLNTPGYWQNTDRPLYMLGH
ncbi:ABC-type dipeptide transport system periplasmic component [Vibrio variabilis]|uniref:ABC-type dipeptide transport system periplasmic component n=1 Tax=Vibrio variabilis TaxID=990271 RepID=A0ABQ0JET5_9VIBR|nr:ABC-type dipeptide transport system periplasmic component [Vibrio variabilis]